ncbi:peptidyl-tRNA hydrolase ICT1, mitochondrial [Trichogramma pretiosum]|uniref:peptidyl-tRNA hydrolase ICT1, mitochondrial n=1 Tax=Trichogramma pretiosum TaxID=7493 RepID=UPI0006C964C3|nr:peptidyl-tRNA hydrolase ICT1, mitochondrial [Trichogramma pretiosum]
MNFVGRQCLRILKNDSTATKHVLGFGRSVSFKSAYSLENLYPKSNLTIHTPKFVPEDPNAKFTGYIPLKELDITFSGSSGPGGQNVQRVNTKVDLRFNVKSATWIDDELKEKILEKYKNRINKDGYLVIKSELTRSQQLNVADAMQKLRQMIRDLIVVPVEPDLVAAEKHRLRQMKAAQERVFTKRMNGMRKRNKQALDRD